MRDPERIPKVLYQIERVWEAFPDLRLGQLILNATNSNSLYYIEDDDLIHQLLEMAYKYAKEIVNGET